MKNRSTNERVTRQVRVTQGTAQVNRLSFFVRPILTVASVLVFCTPLSLYAWGHDGHQTIGAIADRLLKGTVAEKQVSALLGGGKLEKYAMWADCAKGPRVCKGWYDEEMKAYSHRYTNKQAHVNHRTFHYTDIPIQENHYSDESVGAKPNDIVHILRQCIEVLKGRDTPQTNPHGFSKRLALILVAHLVGDIHQPLHVGTPYVGPNNEFVDPNLTTTPYRDTHGGGLLMRTRTNNLHAYWDTNVVKRGMTNRKVRTPAAYAEDLMQEFRPPAPTPGDVVDWPEKWADETLHVAAQAYSGITLGDQYIKINRHGHDELVWPITKMPAGYANKARYTAAEQVAKAGYRLAELLKAIWP